MQDIDTRPRAEHGASAVEMERLLETLRLESPASPALVLAIQRAAARMGVDPIDYCAKSVSSASQSGEPLYMWPLNTVNHPRLLTLSALWRALRPPLFGETIASGTLFSITTWPQMPNPGVWWLMEVAAALSKTKIDPSMGLYFCVNPLGLNILQLPGHYSIHADGVLERVNRQSDTRPRWSLPPTPGARLNRVWAKWERAMKAALGFFSGYERRTERQPEYDAGGAERTAWLTAWAERWTSDAVPSSPVKTGAPKTKTRVPKPARQRRTKRKTPR